MTDDLELDDELAEEDPPIAEPDDDNVSDDGVPVTPPEPSPINDEVPLDIEPDSV